MPQEPDWTLPGNSLNMQLSYKDDLDLIENGNMRLSKSIIEHCTTYYHPNYHHSYHRHVYHNHHLSNLHLDLP